MRRSNGFVVIASLVFLLLLPVAGSAVAEDRVPGKPGPRDRCPVCGMFVAPYPNWMVIVEHRDEGLLYFDGVKDMLRYLADVPTYAPQRRREDVERVFVTDYYSTRLIDGKTAYYVIGSDVLGPMGHELVPHGKAEHAESFRIDHHGDRILRFDDFTPEILKELQ